MVIFDIFYFISLGIFIRKKIARRANPLHERITLLAALLTLPDFSATAIIQWLFSIIVPNQLAEISEIWNVFLSTFPLTLAVLFITVLFHGHSLTIWSASGAIILAAIIGNLLHHTSVPFEWPSFDESGNNAFMYVITAAWFFLKSYWTTLPCWSFIKSLVLGIVAGNYVEGKVKKDTSIACFVDHFSHLAAIQTNSSF